MPKSSKAGVSYEPGHEPEGLEAGVVYPVVGPGLHGGAVTRDGEVGAIEDGGTVSPAVSGEDGEATVEPDRAADLGDAEADDTETAKAAAPAKLAGKTPAPAPRPSGKS